MTKQPNNIMIHDDFIEEYLMLLEKRREFEPIESSTLSYLYSPDEDGVGVLPISGSLIEGSGAIYRKYGFDVTGYGEIRDALSRMRDDKKVKYILLEINSPGGSAMGVHKTAMAIAKTGKPTTAAISGYGASAAYYLASQADEIISEPDAIVGSIGTKSVIYDYSKLFENEGIKTHVFASGPLKATGTVGASITDEQAAAWQRTVDELAGQFFEVVSAARVSRGLDIELVKTGDVWTGARAAEVGLVDAVMSADDWFNARKQKRIEMAMDEEAIKAAAETARQAAIAAETERLNTITEAFPDDPAYVMSAYRAGKTAVEAKAEYCDVLKARLAEFEAKNEALQACRGAQAVETDGKPVETEKLDYLAMARRRVEQTGCKLTDAYSWVSKNHPDVYAEYLRRDI